MMYNSDDVSSTVAPTVVLDESAFLKNVTIITRVYVRLCYFMQPNISHQSFVMLSLTVKHASFKNSDTGRTTWALLHRRHEVSPMLMDINVVIFDKYTHQCSDR